MSRRESRGAPPPGERDAAAARAEDRGGAAENAHEGGAGKEYSVEVQLVGDEAVLVNGLSDGEGVGEPLLRRRDGDQVGVHAMRTGQEGSLSEAAQVFTASRIPSISDALNIGLGARIEGPSTSVIVSPWK
jgi:hypothetical protein